MQKQGIYILLIYTVLVSLTFACKKKNVIDYAPLIKPIDTLYPLNYFPAYPGSYWTYVDSVTNDTIYDKTDSCYVKDTYFNYSTNKLSDTVYVPLFNGYPLWEYSIHDPLNSFPNFYSFLLNPVTSDIIWSNTKGAISNVFNKIISRDTTILIDGISYYPTVVSVSFPYSAANSNPDPNYNPNPSSWLTRSFYTKDIGLVKIESWYLGTIYSSKKIVDYHINN